MFSSYILKIVLEHRRQNIHQKLAKNVTLRKKTEDSIKLTNKKKFTTFHLELKGESISYIRKAA